MKLREKKTDWWNEILATEKKSIEKGIEEADNGNLTSHSSVKKIYEKIPLYDIGYNNCTPKF